MCGPSSGTEKVPFVERWQTVYDRRTNGFISLDFDEVSAAI